MKQQQDGLIALVEQDDGLVGHTNVPVGPADGGQVRIGPHLDRRTDGAVRSHRDTRQSRLHYLVCGGDPDQRVHLVQAANAATVPGGRDSKTDGVCVLVGQKFNVAPRRHFTDLTTRTGRRTYYNNTVCLGGVSCSYCDNPMMWFH